MPQRRAVVALKEGLHARPAAQFVRLAKGFGARIEVVKGERVADAKSMARLMLLAVQEGEEVLIRAEGDDAEQALDGLTALVASASTDPAPDRGNIDGDGADGVARGLPGFPGVAVGPAFLFLPEDFVPERRTVPQGAIAAEMQRFHVALDQLATQLRGQSACAAHAEQRDVLAALADLATDAALTEQADERIAAGQDAASAAHEAGWRLADEFARSESEYFRARAEDVRDLTRRIASALSGVEGDDPARIDTPCIVIAAALGAADFARLPMPLIQGLVLLDGGPTSHVAIMARAHGLPLVIGAPVPREALRGVREVALDGGAGVVVLDPDPADRARFVALAAAASADQEALRALASVTPRTRAGQAIEIAANIGSVEEAASLGTFGAMGVGLFRTEFLFMHSADLPDEEAQYRAYRQVLEACAPHAAVIRTLDIGGDKPLPGFPAEAEENPFLGWRGIRMCLDRPALFKPQLRALLRAAPHGRLRVMFPMVADVAELRGARALLDEAAAELAAGGLRAGSVEVGVMIETPAAALCADALAREVDFFSIGTNDLTQYTMAADRGHRRLAHLGRADHPAVLRLIELTCEAARARGIWVGVCGESAGDPALIPTLLGMGVTELSMSAPLIARAKQVAMSC